MTRPLERARNAVLATRYPGITFSDTLSPEISEVIHEIGKSDEIARAVLTAIREPSEGMLLAGERGGFGDPYYGGDQLADSYRSMIDAALSEGG